MREVTDPALQVPPPATAPRIAPWTAVKNPPAIRLAVGDLGPGLRLLGWTLVACLLLLGIGQCFTPVTAQDEGELLVYPWLIALGRMPYRDIWMMYPPSTYLILAALFKVGVPGLLAERALSLASRILSAVLVNRLLTGSWTRLSLLGTPLVLSLLFYEANTDMRAYPWVVGMPLVFLAFRAAADRPYLSAALFLVAGTFRYEFAAAGLVALGTLAAMHVPDEGWGLRHWRASLALLVGTVAFCLALNVVTGGAAIQETIIQPLLSISPGRRLPLWPPHFGWWGIPLELLIFFAPLALVVGGLWWKRPSIVATNLACLVLDTHFVQRADWIYLLWVGALVMPWTLISLVDLAPSRAVVAARAHPTRAPRGPDTRTMGRSIAVVGIAVTGWYTALTFLLAPTLSPLSPMSPFAITQDSRLMVRRGSNVIIEENVSNAEADRDLIGFLDARARPTDSVFIAPRALRYAIWNMTSLYYVLGPRPATPYLEMNPGVETRAAIQRQIISDLAHCRWIVLTNQGYWYEPNTSHNPGSALLERFIWRHYRVVFFDGSFWLLERTGERAATTRT